MRRTFRVHDQTRNLRLSALRDSPDAFGSTLEGEESRSDEEWERRLRSAEGPEGFLPLVAESGDRFVGLAWGRLDVSAEPTVHIYQMWVAPDTRGQGVGGRLLDEVIGWARRAGAVRVALSVTCGNTVAEKLYTSRGFRPLGRPGSLRPGSSLLSQLMRLDL